MYKTGILSENDVRTGIGLQTKEPKIYDTVEVPNTDDWEYKE